MISKAKVKFIKSLQIKKYRKQEQCFLVEGAKSTLELLNSDFDVLFLVATEEFIQALPKKAISAMEIIETTPKELDGLGGFQTNDTALAVARMKPNDPIQVGLDEFALVLDDIRDPGNLGTIVRTADWFGINKIIASPESADFYNPKVISASMGSFTRVTVHYTELTKYLGSATSTIFGTFLEGEDVHQVTFGRGGLIVIGNESTGISQEVSALISKRVTIPGFGKTESLNAAVAMGIVLDNLKRQ